VAACDFNPSPFVCIPAKGPNIHPKIFSKDRVRDRPAKLGNKVVQGHGVRRRIFFAHHIR